MVNISGPGGFRLDFPFPRLPRWIGTPNLSASNVVYPRVNLDIPIAVQSASVTAGAMATVLNIDTSAIANWSTRFGALFKEFAIVGARFEVRITSATTPQGMILAYVDEGASGAPTASALDYAHAEIPITSTSIDSTGSLHRVEWTAHSFADLTWDLSNTSGVVGYLKLYASTGSTGTAAGTTANVLITGSYAVCFRGYV